MPRPRRFLLSLTAALVLSHPSLGRAAFGHVTLVGYHAIPSAIRITAVCGYTDSSAGREYALVGDWYNGFYVIDVTDPANPTEASRVGAVPGFDLAVFGHYVYCCDGNATGVDSRIVDIANPVGPHRLSTTFASCHSIAISPGGTMFTEYAGVRIYDLSTDPTAPDSLYVIANQGSDAAPRGNRLYDFNGAALNIWDISNPAAPAFVGVDDDSTIGDYTTGDESADHNYLYVCDGSAVTPAPDIVIFDVSDPSAPQRVGEINDPTARASRLVVSGNLMFVAYYTAGFKVFDITDPASPVLAGEYDTSPYQTETGPDVFDGAWGVYPSASTGFVYVSDHPGGLYVFAIEGFTPPTAVANAPAVVRLAQNFPNPFNPSTVIPFAIGRGLHAVVRVYDVRGALVRTLLDESLPAGAHQIAWDGKDAGGRAVASGVYYYRLEAGPTTLTRRMVLLK